VFVEDVLHLLGGDVLPTGIDHVLLAVQEVEEPLLVELAQVAGVQPSSAQCLRGLLLEVVIALHHRGAAHDDLAHLAH
jgi:hypothetical protein